MRRIVAALAPAELEGGALADAIRRMLSRLAAETEIATELNVDPGFPGLPTVVEVALLRTAQSALANVRIHAAAHRVVVGLVDAGDVVRLEVVDDGHGFDVPAWDAGTVGTSVGGYGLHSMRARPRELGGSLEVTSTAGAGTVLRAEVPMARRTGEDGPE